MTTLAAMPSGECWIRSVSLLLLAWILAVIALAASGELAASGLLLPALVLAPVAGFALAYRMNPSLREYVLSLDPGILVIVHGWRMLGLGFLFLHAHDILPGLFAWLAGSGDVLVAVSATLIGIRLLRGRTLSRRLLLTWNGLGVLDFLVALGLGTALRSSWFGSGVGTDPMTQLPLSLVPTLIVPIYLITHLVLFLQLWNRVPD